MNAWTVIKKRSHSVQRVYIHDKECSELMLIGHVEMTVAHDQSVDMEFTARMVISRGSPVRLRSYQVWAVSCSLYVRLPTLLMMQGPNSSNKVAIENMKTLKVGGA